MKGHAVRLVLLGALAMTLALPASPASGPRTDLRVAPSPTTPGALLVSWTWDCGLAEDFAVYEGTLGNWNDHQPVTCTDAGGDRAEEWVPLAGDRYFLVVSNDASDEDSYGVDSAGAERPAAIAACRPTQRLPSCRVDDGLLLYYPFDAISGTVATDRAPTATPMNLDLSGSVSWLGSENGVRFDGGRIGTSAPATQLIDALTLTSRSTFEVWCEPDNLSQSGPARIISLGADPSLQNFMLGQVADDIEVRLLHTGKSAGADPRLSTADGFLTTALTHLVHVYDGTTERLYVNGVAHPTEVVSTGVYAWDPTDPFGIGNAATNNRPWRGTVRQVAVYDRALSPAEIGLNFDAGPAVALAPRPPSLDFSPTATAFTSLLGNPPPTQTVLLTSSNGLPAVFSIAEDADWLEVQPAGGTTPETLTLTVDPIGLADGTYVESVTASATGLADGQMTARLIATSTPLSFTEITASAGTGGPPEFGGHGIQFADVTQDGRPDAYVTMNGGASTQAELFYRNVDGVQFLEEAGSRGIADLDSGTHGAVWGDLDNDGDYDLFNGAYTQNQLFENGGGGLFTDVTPTSGLPARNWETRAVLAFEMDGDGDLDLFAVNGYLGATDPPGERNEVYRNDGGLQFTSIDSGDLFTAPAGQGATDSDFDNDGDIDILAANRGGPFNLLVNDGAGNFTLTDPSTLGISHVAGDGIALADVDNDGDLDLLLQDQLYLREATGLYTHAQSFVIDGYMGGFEDLDNDGDWDLVFPGDAFVYLNDGTGGFAVSPGFTLGTVNDPRAVAFADIDDDGDVDIFYAQKAALNRLIRNDYSGSNGWLKVRLTRASGQAGAFGSRVFVYPAGQLGNDAARIAWREARSQEGYLGQNEPVLHFGLGGAQLVDVRAVFPGGTEVDLTGVLASQTIEIVEPAPP